MSQPDLQNPSRDPQGDLSAKDAARELAISETSVKRLFRAGTLRSYRAGKLWRTTRANLDAFRASGGSRPALPPPVQAGSIPSAL